MIHGAVETSHADEAEATALLARFCSGSKPATSCQRCLAEFRALARIEGYKVGVATTIGEFLKRAASETADRIVSEIAEYVQTVLVDEPEGG